MYNGVDPKCPECGSPSFVIQTVGKEIIFVCLRCEELYTEKEGQFVPYRLEK